MDGSDSMDFVVGLPSVMCQPGAFSLLWPLHGPPGTGSTPRRPRECFEKG